MPASLRWIALLLAFAIVATPISLAVQRVQTARTTRATAEALTHGDVDLGRIAIVRHGCGACHQIDGIAGAQGRVGSSLKGVATRVELAGRTPNAPASLQRLVRHPQEVIPGVGMPDMGIGEQEGRDIAAYLYTLR